MAFASPHGGGKCFPLNTTPEAHGILFSFPPLTSLEMNPPSAGLDGGGTDANGAEWHDGRQHGSDAARVSLGQSMGSQLSNPPVACFHFNGPEHHLGQ